jgi:hypothetical protein
LTNQSDVAIGKADKRVNSVQQCPPWIVGLNPLLIGVGDFVVEPDECAPG